MNLRIKYLTSVFATGFIVLTLLSLPLFFARLYCRTALASLLAYADDVRIRPSLLVSYKIETDPNVVDRSEVNARFSKMGIPFESLGLPSRFQTNRDVYDFNKSGNWLYFDRDRGLINLGQTYKQKQDGKTVIKTRQFYIGPEGISETPADSLGRFFELVVDRQLYRKPWIIYDKKWRQFFSIDFEKRTVTKSQLPKNDQHQPIQLANIQKNGRWMYINWVPPFVKTTKEIAKKTKNYRKRGDNYLVPIINRKYTNFINFLCLPGPVKSSRIDLLNRETRTFACLSVLDKSGRIDLLDRETLTFVGTAGYLPAAQTFFPSKQNVTPKDLLAYEVMPLTLENDDYRGMYVASVNRQGTGLTLAVFDPNGKALTVKHSEIPQHFISRGSRKAVPSSKAFFFYMPWSPFHTVLKYLIENLQPPALGIASYIAADSFEAESGHRALFILPNSFVAMFGRETGDNETARFIVALLIIGPSLLLSILLGRRVYIDADKIGLSQNAKLLWLLGTIAFGLAAYITYRLTKPKIILVTCENCGKLRRPDMENCHHCNSLWRIPELTAPAWRVRD